MPTALAALLTSSGRTQVVVPLSLIGLDRLPEPSLRRSWVPRIWRSAGRRRNGRAWTALGPARLVRRPLRELRELCVRYGFAYYREWGLILDGWSRADESGIDLARRGIGNLKTAGSFGRRPYWLSLLADLLARNDRLDAAQATLDAALVTGRERDDLWWLPEVMRLRAAHDRGEGALSRLRSA